MQTKGSTVSVDNKMLSKMNKIFLTNNEIDFMPTIWQEFNLEHFDANLKGAADCGKKF